MKTLLALFGFAQSVDTPIIYIEYQALIQCYHVLTPI